MSMSPLIFTSFISVHTSCALSLPFAIFICVFHNRELDDILRDEKKQFRILCCTLGVPNTILLKILCFNFDRSFEYLVPMVYFSTLCHFFTKVVSCMTKVKFPSTSSSEMDKHNFEFTLSSSLPFDGCLCCQIVMCSTTGNTHPMTFCITQNRVHYHH